MARGRTERVRVGRFRTGEPVTRTPDDLIVEEPLAIELDGVRVATTMRTPGRDFELAVGYCFTEGLLGGAPVHGCRYCTPEEGPADFNVVRVDTGGLAPRPTPRLTPTSSSCGICGTSSVEELTARLAPLDAAPFPPELLADLPARVAGHQPLFERTGGVHAAGAFDRDGRLVVLREDIGRHNAVDKVVGHLLLDRGGSSATDPAGGRLALYVSGRASFEMVQKAWAAGFAAVVAVSAPSALAVRTAVAARLQLAGFARDGQLNLYAPEAG